MISDYGDVPALASAYHVAADLTGAVAQAVNAGIDVSMTPSDSAGWNSALLQAVRQGLVTERRIDESVRRILTLKFQLGLFDHPLVDPDKADAAVTANRDLARKAAGESITLLRNQDSTLPLTADLGKIVVTGPSAGCEAADPSADPACQAAIANQLGGWSVSWQGAYQPLPPGDHELLYRTAQPDPDRHDRARRHQGGGAVHRRRLGAGPGRRRLTRRARPTPWSWSSARRRTPRAWATTRSPTLPADQQELIAALKETGKPVIVVVIAGRPLGVRPRR